MVVTQSGLLRFDPNTLTVADLSVGSVQGLLGFPASRQPHSIGAVATRHTDELWAMATLDVDEGVVLRGVTFRDGFFYTNTSNLNVLNLDLRAAGMIAVKYSTGKEMLIQAWHENKSPFTVGRIGTEELYGPGFSSLPPVYEDVCSYVSSRLSPSGGAAGLSILPTQVRFWRAWDAGGTWEVAISLDEGAFTALTPAPASGATGAVVLAVPASLSPRLGRSVQVRLRQTGTLTDGNFYRTEFPISVDFEYVPSTNDNVTIRLSVTSEEIDNLGGEWIRSAGRTKVDALIALRGTNITVEFTDGVQWTVLVREVTAEMIEPESPHTNSPGWLATLDCRRL